MKILKKEELGEPLGFRNSIPRKEWESVLIAEPVGESRERGENPQRWESETPNYFMISKWTLVVYERGKDEGVYGQVSDQVVESYTVYCLFVSPL